MTNVARDVIWPTDDSVLVRVVMLNVGQGDSSVVLVRDGSDYKVLLVDINLHTDLGIDIPALMKDLVGDDGIDAFINTHPHNDHLCGITELNDAIDIREVWHSGHVPGKDDCDAYDNLKKVIEAVKEKHGDDAETALLGSRTAVDIGDAQYHVLSPAEHIVESIANETEKERRKRIHEQSVVIKFGADDAWIMLSGDADRDAWELNITKYHKDRIGAAILSAAHHGSRTFFKHDEDDEPYLDALEGIDPEYIVMSAPQQKDSRHGHPHDDAVELYEDQVGKDGLFHTGKDAYSFICDIHDDGSWEITNDEKQLLDAYPYGSEKDGGDEDKKAATPQKSRRNVEEARPFA